MMWLTDEKFVTQVYRRKYTFEPDDGNACLLGKNNQNSVFQRLLDLQLKRADQISPQIKRCSATVLLVQIGFI